MQFFVRVVACAAIVLLSFAQANAQTAEPLYVAVFETVRAPIGWIGFCKDYPFECATTPTAPRDVILTPVAFQDLVRVNAWVNKTIKPMSDIDHWGVLDKWSYPDDGYGDCEDYVLLKRRMLIEAGWPREALLITVVRDKQNEGHAVLTVKTDQGEFILDNQVDNILPWHETGYRFVKRQSQHDPNVWVSLADLRPLPTLQVTVQYVPPAVAKIVENNVPLPRAKPRK